MKLTFFAFFKTAFLISICCSFISTKAQEKESISTDKKLYNTILHLDSVMFDAFNTHHLDTLRAIFSEDIEFYHDMGGLTDYKQNIESFKEAFKSERKVRRELVPNSVEVSPIKDYGAVQTGTHRFYATEKGKQEKLSSEAKFITLWRLKDGKWKVTRIISYAHQEYLK
ncbi:nuclear transport factor 2 family protein [Pedobacter immunditicola]|uniref:nuclear transport factor 2 family protein n=1 Tax=Pedobacter immunditicola TaxID=3133440 RepID=UPI0030ADC1DA